MNTGSFCQWLSPCLFQAFRTLSLGMMCLMASGAASAPALQPVEPTVSAPRPTDYTLMWWAYGWQDRQPRRNPAAEGRRVMSFQTGEWGMALDMDRVRILNLGPIAHARPYAEAARQDNSVIFNLPKAELELSVFTGGEEYRCVRGGDISDASGGWRKEFPFRIIESGRWLQRCDIQGLVFENARKQLLNATGRLEVAAWPDRLSFQLEVTPGEDLHDARIALVLSRSGKTDRQSRRGDFKKGETVRLMVAAQPAREAAHAADMPVGEGRVLAFDPDTSTPAKVSLNLAHGWQTIELPWKNWDVAADFNHLDRLKLRLENPEDGERVFRLQFAMDYPFPGVTGLTPMLRDAAGNPTGIPVQISKNWHKSTTKPLLYEGPWFHGFTLLRLPARSRLDCEFSMAYAGWGGVPAASHAQLCLIGWGTNQLWDQAAIGSWGESICYDPEMAQNRSLIDDVRPLLVHSMGGNGNGKWSWTNNVGGGDFLVYFDKNNQRQQLARMRTAYLRYGPNLTGVQYAGVTADGAIAASINVASPRCDDLNRAWHRFRYDVLKETLFTRLAFYQLGADRYNDHQFDKLARGNEAGLVEEWAPEKGGLHYQRQGIPCPGRAPWFSLHEGHGCREETGAWANRGLVIRAWKARLGGKVVPFPFAAVFGTQDGFPSANLELAPPSGLTRLLPGDFVEAEVELVIVPQQAADYYGPNQNLRAALRTGGNTWRPVAREAAGNRLDLKAIRGKILHENPIAIQADGLGGAAVEVTGGLGYVPLTFSGLRDYRGYRLWQTVDGKRSEINQAIHGGDFWQTDYDPAGKTWSLTFNVNLDSPGDVRRPVRLELGRK